MRLFRHGANIDPKSDRARHSRCPDSVSSRKKAVTVDPTAHEKHRSGDRSHKAIRHSAKERKNDSLQAADRFSCESDGGQRQRMAKQLLPSTTSSRSA